MSSPAMLIIVRTVASVLCLVTAIGAEVPSLPSELPVSASPSPTVPRARMALPSPSQFAAPAVANPSAVKTYQPATVGDDVLSWDSLNKEFTAKTGEVTANFSFSVTNIAKTNVVINWVRPSCGCTVAKLPPTPWTLTPGEGGNIELAVDLKNKFGVLSKYVNVDTSGGQKILNLKITIPNAQPTMAGGPDARTRNMQVAMADRQAVFRGECASCHAAPAVGKKGEQLYAAACAVCHDAPHRATMVPDLRALKNATGKEYWAQWITNGKPGSLMPAFAKAQGGPLDNDQISSLAEFLNDNFPKGTNAPTATAANTAVVGAQRVAPPNNLRVR